MKATTVKILLMTGAWAAALCAPLSADQAIPRPGNLEPGKKTVDRVLKDEIAGSSREPTLKLPEALEIATTYLKAERVDLSGHFLESIRLTDVEGKVGSYWELTWIPNKQVIGGEIWVHVSMDRRLNPGIERGR